MGPPTETRLCDTLERAVKDSAPGLGASVMSARLAFSGFPHLKLAAWPRLPRAVFFTTACACRAIPVPSFWTSPGSRSFRNPMLGASIPFFPELFPELMRYEVERNFGDFRPYRAEEKCN